MLHCRIPASLALAVLAVAPCAQAAGDAELAQIREQIRQLKESYEAQIHELEQRIERAEALAATVQASAASVETTAATPAPVRNSTESAFNPAISLVLQGSYNDFSRDPNAFSIGGFIPAGGEGLGPRGFSLGESELTLSANIDPQFRGQFTAAIAPDDSIEVEEAYFQTLGLSRGLTLKGGRFFSGIGYLNEQHQHAWDFVDAPLAYQAFLGTGARGNFSDDGLQLKWIAPTELFVELGAEATRGRSFPGSDRNKNGIGLGTVFAHVGGDVGTSHAWRAGLSYLRTRAENRGYQDVDSAGAPVTNSFSGKSKLWIADFVWKWAPEGNAAYTSFKLQGEYFRRSENGSLVFDVDGGSAVLPGPAAGGYSTSQWGSYLQGVWQFAPYWRLGARYDRLGSGSPDIGLVNAGVLGARDFPLLAPYDPKRLTAMVDYSPSEFSRLRLQWARDESRGEGLKDTQLFLQYLYSLGAHGAHRF